MFACSIYIYLYIYVASQYELCVNGVFKLVCIVSFC